MNGDHEFVVFAGAGADDVAEPFCLTKRVGELVEGCGTNLFISPRGGGRVGQELCDPIGVHVARPRVTRMMTTVAATMPIKPWRDIREAIHP